MDEKRIKRKNVFKVIRSVLETLIILAVVLWGLWSLVEYRRQSRVMTDNLPVTCVMIPSDEIVFGYESAGKAEGAHFIALSYNGITEAPRVGGKIVTKVSFEKQIEALKASGYQTITQQDVINFYRNGDPLPDRALLLILEDGIMYSAELAQPELVKNNYIATVCTFAQNMSDAQDLYITAEEARMLNQTSYWETGSNGYRLSYINVFDRFENYFGHLNTAEFLDIHNYLRRDYNHYLMDFLRDENRLRTESVSEMEERIAWDYEKMNEIYQDELGYVPGLYILMHSNTGAFGNDPLVSMKNAEMMEKYFSLNFNRQGTCLNMRDSSIYDLSRLQSRQYFSTNHLMMRIWDDTGHRVMFRLGDERKAADWERRNGVAEYTEEGIILTTMPYGQAKIRLLRELPKNLELTVRLQGNMVGQQALIFRADENGENGITIRLHDNVLYLEEGEGEKALLELDLLQFDGGPFLSKVQEEYNGKLALAYTIIANDTDEDRIRAAEAELEQLRGTVIPGIADGAEPFVPELDIDDEDDRILRIHLEGTSISCWLDGVQIADGLRVGTGAGNNLFLEAEVTRGSERFSQTNLSDDVYDGIFNCLSITDLEGRSLYSLAPIPVSEDAGGFLAATADWIIKLFHGINNIVCFPMGQVCFCRGNKT